MDKVLVKTLEIGRPTKYQYSNLLFRLSEGILRELARG